MPEFEFKRFLKIIFGRLYTRYIYIYIVTTRASEFTQLYISYKKFYLIKKLSDLQEFYIGHTHITIQAKHSYISKSVSVLFH